MGATQFKALDFQPNEVITRDKLDQMQDNLQWINDNTPRGRLFHGNARYESDLVIVSGRTLISRAKYKYVGAKSQYFGPWFEPGTAVNISTGVISDQKKQVFCVVNGLGNSPHPDYRGFAIYISITTLSARPKLVKGKRQRDKPDRPIYVSWMATGLKRGYKTDGI